MFDAFSIETAIASQPLFGPVPDSARLTTPPPESGFAVENASGLPSPEISSAFLSRPPPSNVHLAPLSYLVAAPATVTPDASPLQDRHLQAGKAMAVLAMNRPQVVVPPRSAPPSPPQHEGVATAHGRHDHLRCTSIGGGGGGGANNLSGRGGGSGKSQPKKSRGVKKDPYQDQKKPYMCPDPNCGKAFARQFNYKTHLQTHRPRAERELHDCTKCTRTFTRGSGLIRHDKSMHGDTDAESASCTACGQGFRRKDSLRKHGKICRMGAGAPASAATAAGADSEVVPLAFPHDVAAELA
ncbi:hypothetical protein HK405_011602 [Cladochytrium tenue]|nr:hypothetical protein HK405_011602 [Cladochytrium tenue]